MTLQPASPKNLNIHPCGRSYSLRETAKMEEAMCVADVEDVVDAVDKVEYQRNAF
jgi:hypothetical protein